MENLSASEGRGRERSLDKIGIVTTGQAGSGTALIETLGMGRLIQSDIVSVCATLSKGSNNVTRDLIKTVCFKEGPKKCASASKLYDMGQERIFVHSVKNVFL